MSPSVLAALSKIEFTALRVSGSALDRMLPSSCSVSAVILSASLNPFASCSTSMNSRGALFLPLVKALPTFQAYKARKS